MLVAHRELRLTIAGHIDDVGDATANFALSDRRAAAVCSVLVEHFGVDASRLESIG